MKILLLKYSWWKGVKILSGIIAAGTLYLDYGQSMVTPCDNMPSEFTEWIIE